jgi:hypothetical protein
LRHAEYQDNKQMRILIVCLGLFLVVTALLESFETMILPRRPSRALRLTRLFYVVTWRPWRWVARRIGAARRHETFLAVYGPLSILLLAVVWAAQIIVGFAGFYFTDAGYRQSFGLSLFESGVNFFTLGGALHGSEVERAATVIEAGVGFGFLAVVISYLPVLYQSFARREASISLLDARAGSPPTAAELLRRHIYRSRIIGVGLSEDDLISLFGEWERWSAQLLESHISYPVLGYFRSQHDNQSWLAALTAVLDGTAAVLALSQSTSRAQAQLTFSMARHAIVDLAQVFHTPPKPPATDRLNRAAAAALLARADPEGRLLRMEEPNLQELLRLRQMYEPYLNALSAHFDYPLPPWFSEKPPRDNWQTTAFKAGGYSSEG